MLHAELQAGRVATVLLQLLENVGATLPVHSDLSMSDAVATFSQTTAALEQSPLASIANLKPADEGANVSSALVVLAPCLQAITTLLRQSQDVPIDDATPCLAFDFADQGLLEFLGPLVHRLPCNPLDVQEVREMWFFVNFFAKKKCVFWGFRLSGGFQL